MIKTDDKYFFGLVYENFGTPKLLLNDLTAVESCNTYSFFNLVDTNFKNIPLKPPYMIVHVDGNIPQFETAQFDAATVEYLNKEGLDIYIYEVTLFYQGPARKRFYIDTDKFNSSDDIIFDSQNTDNMRCFEFDSIADMIANNGLTNVTVHVLDYQNEKYFQHKYPTFNIISEEFFIKTLISNDDTSYGFNPNFKNKHNSNLIEHKFISLNWRYTTYRHLIATYVSNLDSICTWGFNTSIEDAEFYFDITQWARYPQLLEANKSLLKRVPLVLDVVTESTAAERERHSIPVLVDNDPMFCPMEENVPIDSYAKCFCAIVTESEFYRPTPVIGEKIANAMKCGRPFVLVGAPHCLEYLHTLGFKTFNEYWDESYDNEENHEQRLQTILDVIGSINAKSLDELKEMYDSMLPIIEHNFNILQGYTDDI